MKQNNLEQYVKWLLDIMYYGGCITCISIPILLKHMGQWYAIFQTHYIQMCILFFIAGCCYDNSRIKKNVSNSITAKLFYTTKCN